MALLDDGVTHEDKGVLAAAEAAVQAARDGDGDRRVAFFVLDGEVASQHEELVHDRDVASLRRHVQRRPPVPAHALINCR